MVLVGGQLTSCPTPAKDIRMDRLRNDLIRRWPGLHNLTSP